MRITEGPIPGLKIIENDIYKDSRGHFTELWRVNKEFPPFVQENLSVSSQNVLRGLHLQNPSGQGKLVVALEGRVFDVAVDVRRGSPHFGKVACFDLSAENYRQVYIPPGFAHGFYVLSQRATFMYRCTDQYNKDAELTIRWDDPALNIPWPAGPKVVSDRDQAAPLLKAIPFDRLPSL